MKRYLLAFVLLMMPALLVAQAPQKIATINSQEIMMAMPDTKKAQAEVEKLQKEFEDALLIKREELKKKYEDYISKEKTLPESIKLRQQQEIEDIQKRIDDLTQAAIQDIQKKQQELMAPIQAKVLDAIKKVGNENGFAYILEAGVTLYTGSTAIDATPLVKAKLGIK
ncbi:MULTISPECIES: OmpH family outer membrane protein [Porphyromonas]|uniref:Membrane protein n=1 Tax=Porphyromonas canoris TaxID=36875 RepID=A0ABR4XJM5_9PORP|nr:MULTISPECIES: OmpH family outer membrane protein [Porphyromonas]KGL52693.1 membrane protein [Porphyromonas canoris]KGN67868.1 membrane protein [Porphyromonas sp. COT-108 OH1349]KGN91671.1 membrane protein [Porphyromonas canoris]KGN95745.1 membrane protein [Porphyromonas sp. COT-108 OH2963]